MSLWDGLAHATAQALAATLTGEQRQRGTALIVAKAAKPDADATDLMILANFVVTGFEIIPEPKDDPYPHASGDFTMLGPEIFANESAPSPDTVISWKGENFVPQHAHQGEFVIHDLTVPPVEHPDDPGPEEPSGELPGFDATQPAPMAGTHWQGKRGGQRG